MASILISTALIPLLLGLAFAALVHRAQPGAVVLTLAATLAVLVVTYMLEGLPPLPPVSSKHKLPFVFAALGLVTVASVAFLGRISAVLAALAGIAALSWIGLRKIQADPFQPELFLALLPVAGMTLAAADSKVTRDAPLLWPGTIIFIALSGAFISVSGGYIGLAQLLGALAALVGGYALVGFGLHLAGRNPAPVDTSATVWLLTAALCVVLGSVAIFASKLSVPAFAFLCLGFLAPLIARRLIQSTAWWAPIVQGFPALLVALIAAGIAVVTSF